MQHVNAVHQCLNANVPSWSPVSEQQWKENPDQSSQPIFLDSFAKLANDDEEARGRALRSLTPEQRSDVEGLQQKFRRQVQDMVHEAAPRTKEEVETLYKEVEQFTQEFLSENKERLEGFFSHLSERGQELVHVAEEKLDSVKESAASSLHIVQEKASESLHMAEDKAIELKDAAVDAAGLNDDSTDKE